MMWKNLTADESKLVNRVILMGSDAYPIRKINDRLWTWSFRSVEHPTGFPTKREAVAAFERWFEALSYRS